MIAVCLRAPNVLSWAMLCPEMTQRVQSKFRASQKQQMRRHRVMQMKKVSKPTIGKSSRTGRADQKFCAIPLEPWFGNVGALSMRVFLLAGLSLMTASDWP
jgi:hypothetical protein